MKYLVTPAPHKYGKTSITDMYFTISIALFACLLCGVITYKTKAIYIVLICLATTLVVEFVCSYLKNKKFTLTDFSWLVTALMLACIMPPNVPLYLPAIACVIAIFSKYLFGGLGNNLFNPSGLAQSILGVLVSGMTVNYFANSQTALTLVLSGAQDQLALKDLFFGNVSSAIGTGCIILILILAVLLMILRFIKWENLLFCVGGFALVVWLTMGAGYILPMMLSGSFIFVTVFMLSDPTTSPYTFSGRCVFALIFGMLAGVFMSKNIMGETAVFLALIVANLLNPAIDRVMQVFYKGVKTND